MEVNVSAAKTTYLYVNAAPKVNRRKDGSVFYTVLIGVPRGVLLEKSGEPESKLKNLTVTFEVHESKVDLYEKAFRVGQIKGQKTVIECDDFELTPLRENPHGDKLDAYQASVWPTGDFQLKLGTGKFSVSAELLAAMGELEDLDGDDLS